MISVTHQKQGTKKSEIKCFPRYDFPYIQIFPIIIIPFLMVLQNIRFLVPIPFLQIFPARKLHGGFPRALGRLFRPPRWPFPLDFSSRFPTPSSRCVTRKSSMGRWNLGTKMVKNGGFSLWLCQNSYGTWPLSSLIYLLKHGDFPVRKLLHDQRVSNHQQLVNGNEATN